MNDPAQELNLAATFNPGAPMQRVSQRPGSIPARLRDLEDGETIKRLRAVLNVKAFAREIRQIALQHIEREGQP